MREDGFRVYFFSSDRKEPPHVHVDRGGASARFGSNALQWLAILDSPQLI